MVQYIKEIGREIHEMLPRQDYPEIQDRLCIFVEELNRLDPRDFIAQSRRPFTVYRQSVRSIFKRSDNNGLPAYLQVHGKVGNLQHLVTQLITLLDNYMGEGSYAETRSFAFVKDVELREIVERDYKELSLRVFPSGAWKSAVIIAGSILEAILYDLLTSDATTLANAMAATNASRDKKGVMAIADGKWPLHNLILVATELGFIPADRANTFDQILRDYRNFVHPKKEVKRAHPCTEAEAGMSKYALDGVCNILEQRP